LLAYGDFYPRQEQLVADLKRAIKVDRLTSKRPGKYDDEELQAMAIEKAIQLLGDQREKAIRVATKARKTGNLPFPQVFQPSNSSEAFWMNEFEHGWWPKFSSSDLTKRLSVLTMEGVPEKVRQYLRGFYQQWEAQKRTGKEIPVGHAEPTELR